MTADEIFSNGSRVSGVNFLANRKHIDVGRELYKQGLSLLLLLMRRAPLQGRT
jgi:hypothetical protein